GDQQVDPWHLERTDHGIKLVVLNVNASAERSMDGADVCRGGRAPAHRVEKGIQLVRRIEASGVGQGDFFDQRGSWLNLPDDLELFAQAIVLDGGERQEVLWGFQTALETIRGQETGGDVGHDPVAGTHADQLPLVGGGNDNCSHTGLSTPYRTV